MERKKVSAKVYLADGKTAPKGLTKEESAYIAEQAKQEAAYGILPYPQCRAIVFHPQKTKGEAERLEKIRRSAADLLHALRKAKIDAIEVVESVWKKEDEVLAFMEGLWLSSYVFDELKSKKTNRIVISLKQGIVNDKKRQRTEVICQEVNQSKHLIDLPFTSLNAASLAAFATKDAASLGLKVTRYNKAAIEKMGMGGLLGVNRGSVDEPTFTCMEYKPTKATNKKPVVLVGKGVVFDAGGMNIKTGNYMEDMKTDMAGAAVVMGIVRSAARAKLPLHVIGLLPSTDNRLNGNALVCGDVITMYDGTTVEVNNTDAEGRLLLADSVAYAQKKLDPLLVVSIATLTGAAARALGSEGIAAMQQNADKYMPLLLQEGERTHERLCFFPMWKEYEKELESEVADLKNCGSGAAGMITAAMFVGHFTNKPFLHLDVAGVEYLHKRDAYRGPGATAFGIRLMMNFLEKLI